ncbi:MAG TPA: hypothetical protein DCS01_06395 [Idiomarina abyssalis]|uniref:DUF3224 domain-containing protein n=1 Tax=Idiomarina piscisalsi TaxID=1096243 RepID=A0A432YPN7_9GAMM|nr:MULTISPECIES: DUF3224 domain-containing protein [Idiomarina]MBH93721.1 hypothetical protein [Idiomarina sp.]RUO62815.1 hypothetical protein CWI73_10130 [Idiomarina piscisalsi]HAS14913.1 hypothetical protein [Idiomarina abyssalis]|tara:strand:+ start:3299 stop:3682 length:384 start_codon:yes stop_codon:yes gene_type:complete
MELTGTFEITSWQESVEKELANGTKLSRANVRQSYTGSLSGESELTYQLCYDTSGNADFVGFETISINTPNELEVIVLQHNGCFNNGIATSKFTVVESSHDKTLIGYEGFFRSKENGQADYQIKGPL